MPTSKSSVPLRTRACFSYRNEQNHKLKIRLNIHVVHDASKTKLNSNVNDPSHDACCAYRTVSNRTVPKTKSNENAKDIGCSCSAKIRYEIKDPSHDTRYAFFIPRQKQNQNQM